MAVSPGGLEPPAFWTATRRSNPLSYGDGQSLPDAFELISKPGKTNGVVEATPPKSRLENGSPDPWLGDSALPTPVHRHRAALMTNHQTRTTCKQQIEAKHLWKSSSVNPCI